MDNKDSEAYDGFAKVYDLFMDNVPYEQWSEYLIDLLKEHGADQGLVLDMACGTGQMTRLLARAGYEMIAVDASAQMLMAAIDHSENDPEILYLMQDMRELELYGTVRAVVCICDSMNYILEEDELRDVFSLVNNYLDPEGVFIFDLNTIHKFKNILGDNTICENREEGSFIWENDYDDESNINEYALTFFVKEKEDLYRRYEEVHYQRGYDLENMITLLKEAGMEFIAAYDAFTKEPPKEDSERIYMIAKENGKRK